MPETASSFRMALLTGVSAPPPHPPPLHTAGGWRTNNLSLFSRSTKNLHICVCHTDHRAFPKTLGFQPGRIPGGLLVVLLEEELSVLSVWEGGSRRGIWGPEGQTIAEMAVLTVTFTNCCVTNDPNT